MGRRRRRQHARPPCASKQPIHDGVDGLITDSPDRLRVMLEERGYRLP